MSLENSLNCNIAHFMFFNYFVGGRGGGQYDLCLGAALTGNPGLKFVRMVWMESGYAGRCYRFIFFMSYLVKCTRMTYAQ